MITPLHLPHIQKQMMRNEFFNICPIWFLLELKYWPTHTMSEKPVEIKNRNRFPFSWLMTAYAYPATIKQSILKPTTHNALLTEFESKGKDIFQFQSEKHRRRSSDSYRWMSFCIILDFVTLMGGVFVRHLKTGFTGWLFGVFENCNTTWCTLSKTSGWFNYFVFWKHRLFLNICAKGDMLAKIQKVVIWLQFLQFLQKLPHEFVLKPFNNPFSNSYSFIQTFPKQFLQKLIPTCFHKFHYAVLDFFRNSAMDYFRNSLGKS